MQKLTEEKQQSLRDYADDLRACQKALQALGSLNELNTQGNLCKLTKKLPFYLQQRWLGSVVRIEDKEDRMVTLQDLVEFVEQAAREADHPTFGQLNRKDKDQRQQERKPSSPRKSSIFNVAPAPHEEKAGYKCVGCGNSHELEDCKDFLGKTMDERVKMVMAKGLCFSCLKAGHRKPDCKGEKKCKKEGCSSRHHSLLHGFKLPPRQEEGRKSPVVNKEQKDSELSKEATRDSSEPESQGTCSHAAGSQKNKMVLPIVAVKVTSPGSEHSIDTYALLDLGSTHTFCTQSLLDELGVKGHEEKVAFSSFSEENTTWRSKVATLEVEGRDCDQKITLPCVYSRPSLAISAENLITQKQLERWPHLQNYRVPEIKKSEVSLLIGQDCPRATRPLETVGEDLDEPYAMRTGLGWAINGPVKEKGGRMHISFVSEREKECCDLAQQMRKFWETESMEPSDEEKAMSVEDRLVLQKWESTVALRDNHYVLPIPFRKNPPNLPDNYKAAMRRMVSLSSKLDKNPDLKEKYTEGMTDLIRKQYAVQIPTSEMERQDGKVWYLPHHPVINPKKDKLRIVFDCAAQYRGVSLNSTILQGPDLTNKLVGVLTKFRLRKVAFTADVEAMFHQVKVPEPDQDVLRFLWWPEGKTDMEPNAYRMTVHLFGGTWSPSCCTFALHKTAEAHEGYSNEASYAIKNNFYVDDCLKSVDSVEEAVRLSRELKQLLQKGGFNLTKWASNRSEVLQQLPKEDLAKNLRERTFDSPLEQRALGVYWDIQSDEFGYCVQEMNKLHTRRGLLSMLSSIYDPLGLAGPFILRARKIVQDLCRQKLGWDEAIPEEHQREWLKWIRELDAMKKVRIPRCILPDMTSSPLRMQLHHFADASELAYGVASYLRAEDSMGRTSCKLIMAKSRLAPIKPMTIPRLELSAATLATRQDALLRRELDVELNRSQFWTDSTIVLQYISNEDKRFQTFVANRIAEIRTRTQVEDWHHVPTKENPADDTSRGLAAEQLTNPRWLNGPQFLLGPPETWPTLELANTVTEDDPEVKASTATVMTIVNEEGPIDRLIKRNSDWRKLLRSVAWLVVSKDVLLKRITPPKRLQAEHIQAAEVALLKYIQARDFRREMKGIKAGKSITNNQLARLRPTLRQGLLCVGSRLKHAQITPEERCPVILPKDNLIAEMLVRYLHERSAHAGREYILAELRQNYWQIGARNVVKKVLRECVTCKRREAKVCVQEMSDLPADRVKAGEPAFTYVGVDYFGPFAVKRGRTREKRYGCLFTCLVTRAIHIEIAHTLDTNSFLNALYRFMARRGQPKVIRSDNGTNFVGGERELREEIAKWNKGRIQGALSEKTIEWKFNPPSASHMGGAWERQVRTVRRVLSGLTREQLLTDELLSTLMCIAEGIVNNRPLTAVSEDSRDPEPLTPNHLLLMRPTAAPKGIFSEHDLYARKKWRQVQYLADLFWKRWTSEYLPQLRLRTKWTQTKRNLAEGDIVLVTDHMLSRNEWPLGKVIKVYPGEDGRVRTIKVRSRGNELIRPIAKVCLLEETRQ